MKKIFNSSMVFYRLGKSNYWAFINTDFNMNFQENIQILSFIYSNEIEKDEAYTIDQNDINLIGIDIEIKPGKYVLYCNKRVLAFHILDDKLTAISDLKELFRGNVLWVVERFRRIMWRNLVSKLYLRKSKTKDVLNMLTMHTFSDHYSLWLYNKHTNYYNLHCSSFDYNFSYIPESIMKDLINLNINDAEFISSNIAKENAISEMLAKMKWVNRFYIDTDIEITGILSFYSKYQNFPFDEKAKSIIPEIIELKLIDEFSVFFKKNINIKYLSENYIPGKLSEFLNGLLPDFIKKFDWEAASIFLIDDSKSKLILKSLAPPSSEVDNNKKTGEEVYYDVSKESLTTNVFFENKLSFSYNIDRDERNTHGFDEPTINKPKNWIGIPIARPGESPIGVLRVVNKLDNDLVVEFNKFDIDILYNISSVIAYICHIEDTFFEKQQQIKENLKKQEEENKQLNEFLKSFRHELKSPLTVVTQASSTIVRAFNKAIDDGTIIKAINLEDKKITDPIEGDNLIPKKIKEVLSDLDMVGNRLVYVTNLLSFEPHDLVKDFDKAHLLQDVVTPVLAFAIQYAKDRRKTIWVDKNSLMHDVFCHAMSVSIAFHILIDNAIKYSNRDSKIFVRGSVSNHMCSIIITSVGLPILQSEKNDIFLRYYRGSYAKKQKIDGSGIGLYLAKEIMKLNNGEIILKKSGTPTTEFELKVKERRGEIR